jgi:sarcosine oxidase, subunit alpha
VCITGRMRIRPVHAPVTVTFDGEPTVCEKGEPLAAGLVAAGRLTLARSAKFHRPRGPACFRGACDGCLARVNDEPNVMTCLVAAEEGLVASSQNTLGSRSTDLLRVTDWFFPEGMNHHELFAGVPGVQRVMQMFARRVAGLGKLPGQTGTPRKGVRREADVVVVGAGFAGIAAASAIAARGRSVELLDDALEPGWGARALAGIGVGRATMPAAGVDVRGHTLAAGIYGDDLLVAGANGMEVVQARAIVLAPGAHDGVLAFEGNDLPNVMSTRAAAWLFARGILAGERLVIVVAPGGDLGEPLARAIADANVPCEVTVVHGTPVRARGSARVREITITTEAGDINVKGDVVAIDTPRAPSYELLEQAGAALTHEPRGFVARTERGKIRDRFFAIGECLGAPVDAARFAGDAEEIARSV